MKAWPPADLTRAAETFADPVEALALLHEQREVAARGRGCRSALTTQTDPDTRQISRLALEGLRRLYQENAERLRALPEAPLHPGFRPDYRPSVSIRNEAERVFGTGGPC